MVNSIRKACWQLIALLSVAILLSCSMVAEGRADSLHEWNLSCNLKTASSTTVYKTEAKEEVKEIIPANTYVKIKSNGADGFCVINYMVNNRKSTGLVLRSSLVRCTSTVRGGSGYADSVHELDPNHDKILATQPVVNVAESLLMQGDKDFSDLTFENPDSKAAAAAQQTAGRVDTVEEARSAAPAETRSAKKDAGTTRKTTAGAANTSLNDWNLSCNYKTACSTTVYAAGTREEKGTIPSNTYVQIRDTLTDGLCVIKYMMNGRTETGVVPRANLVRCSSQYRQSNGMAENVHELDPNYDKILATHDVILVAPSLLQNGDKDYSGLNYEQPVPVDATAAPAVTRSAEKAAGATKVSSGKKDTAKKQTEPAEPAVQISLVQLGTHTSIVQHEGREMEVHTAELQFSADVPEDKRIAYIYAPRTGRCYLRAKGSDKADVLDKCPVGKVVQVVKYGKNYCQIVFEGQVGYVQTACLKFANPEAEPLCNWPLSYNGKTTGSAQVPIRSDKSNDSASVIKLRSGTEVTVFAKSGNWYEIEYEGMHGFVHKNFLLLDE